MPTVSITGATGFIGWHVCEAFRDAGWTVRAIVRPGNQKPLPAGVEIRSAALIPANAPLADALAPSDVVVHAAGLVRARDGADYQTVNVDGTHAVVAAANAGGARVLLISSQAASGSGTPLRPSAEDDPPHPLTAYGRSKLAAEDAVRGARRGWTIVRPPAVYGPGDLAFLPVFKLAARGLFLHVTDRTFPFSIVHVHDLARGIVEAAAQPAAVAQTFFIAQREPVTADALLEHLAALFGRRYRPRRVPEPIVSAMAAGGGIAWRFGLVPLLDPSRLIEFRSGGFVCAVDRARSVLGFNADIPLKAGLAETAAWYKAQGWL